MNYRSERRCNENTRYIGAPSLCMGMNGADNDPSTKHGSQQGDYCKRCCITPSTCIALRVQSVCRFTPGGRTRRQGEEMITFSVEDSYS